MNIFKLVIALFLVTITGCEKDDKKDDTACLKDENFFEANFMDETLEPYFSSGISGRYTLNTLRCVNNEGNWLIRFRTENDISIYFYLTGVNDIGNYVLDNGDIGNVPGICTDESSIYILDGDTLSYTFISTGGTFTITAYDIDLGIFVGSFTTEMMSTTDSNQVATMTGVFNVNKSILDTTKKPCFID